MMCFYNPVTHKLESVSPENPTSARGRWAERVALQEIPMRVTPADSLALSRLSLSDVSASTEIVIWSLSLFFF